MGWLLALVEVALACVFTVAAAGKLFHVDQFSGALRRSYLPEHIVTLLAVVIPLIELSLALLLLIHVPGMATPVLAASMALLMIFTAWLVWVLWRRPGNAPLACGCFGSSDEVVQLRSVVRNLALIVVAGGGLILTILVESALPTFSTNNMVLGTSFILVICLLVGYRFASGGLHLSLSDVDQWSSGLG